MTAGFFFAVAAAVLQLGVIVIAAAAVFESERRITDLKRRTAKLRAMVKPGEVGE